MTAHAISLDFWPFRRPSAPPPGPDPLRDRVAALEARLAEQRQAMADTVAGLEARHTAEQQQARDAIAAAGERAARAESYAQMLQRNAENLTRDMTELGGALTVLRTQNEDMVGRMRAQRDTITAQAERIATLEERVRVLTEEKTAAIGIAQNALARAHAAETEARIIRASAVEMGLDTREIDRRTAAATHAAMQTEGERGPQ